MSDDNREFMNENLKYIKENIGYLKDILEKKKRNALGMPDLECLKEIGYLNNMILESVEKFQILNKYHNK